MLMKNLSFIAGILGLVSAVAGLFLYLIAPEWQGTVSVLESAAVVLLVYFFGVRFEMLRAFSTRRSTKFGANSFLMVAIFLAILAIVNFLLNRHYGRIDLSEAGSYSLSPQTIAVVKGLKDEIKVSAFYKEKSPSEAQAKDLFENYRYYSPAFRYDFIDPDKNPAIARRYGITEYDTVVVEAIRTSPSVPGLNPPEAKETKREETPSVTLRTLNEQELTGAIVRVTRSTKKVVYFSEGHGERGLDDTSRGGFSQVKAALEKQGFSVKKLLLLSEPKVPEDAAALLIAGPQKPYLDQEIQSIEAYLKRGGQLFVLIDPQSGSGLEGLLSRFGVSLKNDIIFDPFSRLFGGSYNIPIVNPGSYARHDLTKDFNLPTFYPLARSVSPEQDKGRDFSFQAVVQTSPNSWATSKVEGPPEEFNPARDRKGPVTIGATVTAKEDAADLSEAGKKARLAVFGDSDFATNNYFQAAGNGDLFLSVVSWLAQEGDLISIRPKEAKTSTLMLTARQGSLLFYIPVVILPMAVFTTGISIWRRRRRL
jgi:ABC-type uncharacterized transport system involved in gliding motility auxiliary subunit